MTLNFRYQKTLNHPLPHSVQELLEGLEGLLTVASLPYSTLMGPLQSVEGRLVAGWLDEQPLLLLLVNLQSNTFEHIFTES